MPTALIPAVLPATAAAVTLSAPPLAAASIPIRLAPVTVPVARMLTAPAPMCRASIPVAPDTAATLIVTFPVALAPRA